MKIAELNTTKIYLLVLLALEGKQEYLCHQPHFPCTCNYGIQGHIRYVLSEQFFYIFELHI